MRDVSLEKRLSNLLNNKKTVLLGVGNPDRGDDGLGPALAAKIGTAGSIHSIVCEEVPENYTGSIRSHNPEIILFVDALDFGGRPGETVLVQSDSFTEDRFNTHRPSLSLVMNYLAHETGAPVWLLGIQPKSVNHGEPLTPEIDEIICQLADIIHKIADEDRV